VYRYEKISQALIEKALAFSYVSTPCVITIDKNSKGIKIRQVKYYVQVLENNCNDFEAFAPESPQCM